MPPKLRTIKKVRFDTSGSIALHLKLGRKLTPEQRKPIELEGWLVGDHICVQKLTAEYKGYCLSLYPWGDRLTAEFFAKADAVACAKDIDALRIPWEHMRTLDPSSSEYGDLLVKVRFILASYEIDGLTLPMELYAPSSFSPVATSGARHLAGRRRTPNRLHNPLH